MTTFFFFFQLKEEFFVSGSEEEAYYPSDKDSDEDLSDIDDKEIHDEVGSGPYLYFVIFIFPMERSFNLKCQIIVSSQRSAFHAPEYPVIASPETL